MRKNYAWMAFWLALGAGFLVIVFLVLCPVYIDVCEAAKDGAAQKCEPQHAIIFATKKILEILSHAETWTALATIAIAAFTWTLKRSTDNLWRESQAQRAEAKIVSDRQFVETQNQIDVARIGANAAKESADAAIAAERARLYIVINDTNLTWLVDYSDVQPRISPPQTDEHEIGTAPRVTYQFQNYGKTPGIIKEISLSMMLAAEPNDPVFTVLLDSFRENMVGTNSLTEPKNFDFRKVTFGEAKAIKQNTMRLWFFGRVSYDDVFGKTQTHGFCFRTVTFNGKCFLQSYDYKHYNYST